MNHRTIFRICLAAFLAALGLAASAIHAEGLTYGATNIVAAENGGRVIAASSQHRERARGPVATEWRMENLIDGKRVEGDIVPALSYGWASANAPSIREPEWVVFGFAGDKQRLIGAVRLDPRTDDAMVIGRWVKNFTIEVSVIGENGPWQRVSNFELINVARPQLFRLPAPTEAKFVRLLINSNQGSNRRVSLGEFEVFEAILGDDELTSVIGGMESHLSRLRRYATAQAGAAAGQIAPPELGESIIAAANGGRVVLSTSVALDEAGNELERWSAENLIDGRVATAAEEPDHTSFGWSSNEAPTEEAPQMVVFAVGGDAGAVIDSAVIDTNARDPWSMMRGARDVELAVSVDDVDGPWKSLGRWTLPMEPARHILDFAPAEALYVRLKVLSNFGSDRYVQLGEFGVFRLSPEVSVVDGIANRIERALVELKRYREAQLAGRDGAR